MTSARQIEYQKYLRSVHWQDRRARRIVLAEGQCEFRECISGGGKWWHGQRCTETTRLEVHHLHYNSLGAERDGDLEVLCRKHHLVRSIGDVECQTCFDSFGVDDDQLIEIVEQAIRENGGVENVTLDMLDLSGLCSYCNSR